MHVINGLKSTYSILNSLVYFKIISRSRPCSAKLIGCPVL